jgi:hypothetical protein
MSRDAKSVLSDALSLPEPERLVVLEGLLESLRPPGLWDVDDPGFSEELRRRSQDAAPGIPWEEVRDQIERREQ